MQYHSLVSEGLRGGKVTRVTLAVGSEAVRLRRSKGGEGCRGGGGGIEVGNEVGGLKRRRLE